MAPRVSLSGSANSAQNFSYQRIMSVQFSAYSSNKILLKGIKLSLPWSNFWEACIKWEGCIT